MEVWREKLQFIHTEEAFENALVSQIVDSIKGEIPEAMFENRSNEQVREFESGLYIFQRKKILVK